MKILVYFLFFPTILFSQNLTSATDIKISKKWYQEPNGYTFSINIFLPSGDAPEGGFPVCILLHGNGGDGEGIINQFKNILECHALVAPSGYLNSWNICDEDSDAPDLEMVDELINNLQTYSNVNPNKIRIIGSSNGAGLANNIFIQNKNSGVDIICSIVSHLNEPQFHNDNFYLPSNSSEQSNSYCGYDSLVYPSTSRKYLSISNDNDPVVPYNGGYSAVGIDFLDAETAAFKIAINQGYTESKITSGIKYGNPEISEYSYLLGNVVHIKGDANHGTNATQQEYIKNYFNDCNIDLGKKDIENKFLTIYPNPTSGNLFIKTLKEFDQIRLYSSHGALLMKSNSESLTISSLPAGTYIFEVEYEDEIRKRIIFKN